MKSEINLSELEYLREDLTKCKLCEWQCGKDRLEGEVGVCGITIPEVSSSQLHGAPPASFDAFMTGCSFRCLSCQNWTVANYPANRYYDFIEGYYHPSAWAELALAGLNSPQAKAMGADRLFFTGGEPTCSLPWVEAVVEAARTVEPSVKVNYDTNGFMTQESLNRILAFSDSITYDIKAFEPKLFRALTGADNEVVLRNAEYIAKVASDKLWEFRILAIPHLHEPDLEGLCQFIADLNPSLPVNFLAFRPNFVMDEHPWATRKLMEKCVEIAHRAGLENTSWSGRAKNGKRKTESKGNVEIAMGCAWSHGCIQKDERRCGACEAVDDCRIKQYTTEKLF
jgi:pyruvate formate lyase activating enzyme